MNGATHQHDLTQNVSKAITNEHVGEDIYDASNFTNMGGYDDDTDKNDNCNEQNNAISNSISDSENEDETNESKEHSKPDQHSNINENNNQYPVNNKHPIFTSFKLGVYYFQKNHPQYIMHCIHINQEKKLMVSNFKPITLP